MDGDEEPENRMRRVSEDSKNGEIRHQVYIIAETILNIAKGVEEALVNITAVKDVLNQITHKLNHNQLIRDEEKALLQLAEQWLNEEKIPTNLSVETSNGNIRSLNLRQITALGTSLFSTSTDDAASSTCLDKTGVTTEFSIGSTQTLNEGAELDWDGNGVELTESMQSTYSGAITAFKSPYALCTSNIIDPEGPVEDTVPKSSSYNGIYEEEMEFTLEVEEGFYSDSSFIEDSLVHDFSPQADSGVTHMDSNASTDRSISHPDEDLTVETSPSYNRNINTWDTFATVNIEEDLLSTPSSANSNTSTPRLPHRQRLLIPAVAVSSHPPSPTFHDAQPPVPTHLQLNKDSPTSPNLSPSSHTRPRANSDGKFSSNCMSTTKCKSSSTPKLSDNNLCIDSASSTSNVQHLDSGGMQVGCTSNRCSKDGALEENKEGARKDSENSSGLTSSTLADSLIDDYDTSCVALPASLRRNNYYHKSRRAVFV